MDKPITIAGSCSWKGQNEHLSLNIDGKRLEMIWNVPDYPAEYCLDMEPPFHDNSKRFAPEKRIYVTTEPAHFDCYTNRHSPDSINDYYKALILSWHEKLRVFPQTRVIQMAGKWVGPMNDKKEFGISGVFSGKDTGGFDGYAMRHGILRRENEIKTPGIVYNFRGRWKELTHQYPLPNKEPSMRYMFHLAIENCREPDWFTEKLIDCFACRVVPMYFGDPNITNIFNKDGMIILDSEKYIDQINALTPEDYSSRAAAIEDNFARSIKYWKYDVNLGRAILEGLPCQK